MKKNEILALAVGVLCFFLLAFGCGTALHVVKKKFVENQEEVAKTVSTISLYQDGKVVNVWIAVGYVSVDGQEVHFLDAETGKYMKITGTIVVEPIDY
tara:strand:+ start:418 stop:711 length:294 start_codon:yes stop_codon:yes gene_type:complete